MIDKLLKLVERYDILAEKMSTPDIISNEPGFYKEGEYGIRIENIIVVKELNKDLLKFENISWAPIDRDLIEPKMLNENELKWINEYHQSVYQKIGQFLSPEEKRWLQKVTMPL